MLQTIRAYLPGRRALSLAEKGAQFLRTVHRQMDEAVPAGATLFLGDSHIYGLVTAAVVPNAVKFGTGGQRSDALLLDMDSYTSLARAACVVVMTGTNDVLEGKDTGLEGRYRAILGRVPPNVPVVLNSIPPVQAPELRVAAQRAARAARAACAAHPRCIFVDLYSALSQNGEPLPGMLWDGVHLSAQGYRVWVRMLRQAIGESAA
jgi:lysophospholipase L1-like esterase